MSTISLATPTLDVASEPDDRGWLARTLTRRGRCGVLGYSARVGVPFMAVILIAATGGGVAAFAEIAGEPPNDTLMTVLAFALVFALLVLVPVYVLSSVQRLHDLGLSGWYYVVMLLPIAGTVFGVYVALAPGRREPNAFGTWHEASTFERVFGIVSLVIGVLILVVWGVLTLADMFVGA